MLRISLHCSVLLLVGLASLLVQGLPSSDVDLGKPQTVQVDKLPSPSPAAKPDLTNAKNNDTTLHPNVTQNNATQANATSVLGQVNDEPANPSQNETIPSTTLPPSPSTPSTVATESSISSSTSEASASPEPTEPSTLSTLSTPTSPATESSSTSTTSTTATLASSSTLPPETTTKEAETTTTTNAPPEQSPQAAEQPEGMSSGIIAVVMAIVFAIVVVIVYAGLLLWRRYLEYRYGNRELLVNDLEFDTNDLRHFEL